MSLKNDRFALVVFVGWLIAILTSPLIIWGYPLFALLHFGSFLVSVIAMIIVNRMVIIKMKKRGIRLVSQIALISLPIFTNGLIQSYQLTLQNPSWFRITVQGDDKLERIVIWKRPIEMADEKPWAKRIMSVHQSGLYRNQSWFFIPGIALRNNYEKVGHLWLKGKMVTEIEEDTVNLKLFDKISVQLQHANRNDSYYMNVRFSGNTYDTLSVRGKVIQFTVFKFIPEKDTGCSSSSNDGRINCFNTGELRIGNPEAIGIDRKRIRELLDSNLKR